ncbi:MAG: N-acetylmuramic acid 6-phosphate etherase [Candidatus Eremiobacteraeota bacterium]|nr:N-acetylmuramic acid 6-phosphate etherase [Candidatus Eremiobacteraeota bacterium]
MSSQLPPTERTNAATAGLDLLDTSALVRVLVGDQRGAVEAVLAQAEPIASVVDEIAGRLSSGGSLHYVGAGTSGRLAVVDAAELPPTFGTPEALVHPHIAGGIQAFDRAVEGAEDDYSAGEGSILADVRESDAVIGLSAGGTAAFVIAAIDRARSIGAFTVAITGNAESRLARAAQTSIVLATGPEVLAGSTRLKAGTAQKIALNSISTAVMVRLGKIYGNLMVDVVATNQKLRARALRLVQAIAGVDGERARELLAAAHGRVKVAIVMERRGLDAQRARDMLDRHGGSLRAVL